MYHTLSLRKAHLTILGRTNEHPPWRHDGRAVDYHHLVLILSGSCLCRIEKRRYTLCGGDLLFIPAGQFYRLTTDDHCEYAFACFTGPSAPAEDSQAERCARTLPEPPQRFFLPETDEDALCLSEYARPDEGQRAQLLALFARAQGLMENGRYLDVLLCGALLQEMLIVSSQCACSPAPRAGRYPLSLERMLSYIEQSFTEHITAESLAERFELSRPHVCALFKNRLNMTVSEYVNGVKLRRGAELLSNSSMNVGQIAAYLGYSSGYYFSRLFKKHYGVSPTGFVKKD